MPRQSRRQSPAERLQTWNESYQEATGLTSPRTVTLAAASPEHQDFAVRRMGMMGHHLPELAETWKAGYARAANSPNANQTNREKAAQALARLESPDIQEEIASRPDTGLTAGGRGFQKLISDTSSLARSRTRFDEQQNPGSGTLYLPAGTTFYPDHHANYEHVARETFGSGYSEEAKRNLIVSGTQFSAGAMPQVEIQGASGMAALQAHNRDIEVKVSHSGADIVNSMIAAQMQGKDADGAGTMQGASSAFPSNGKRAKRVINADLAPTIPLHPGTHKLGDLDPAHAAMIIAHRSGHPYLEPLTPHVDYGKGADWSEPAGAIAGAAGTGGIPAIHKAWATLQNPHIIQPSTGAEQKLHTYALTTLTARPEHSSVIRHLVGASVHGDKYWQRNPGAAEHVRQHINDLGFHNPFAVGDIHHARATSNLSPQLSKLLDDPIRPDQRLSMPKELHHLPGATERSPKGITMPHLAYLAMEHQTNNVGKTTVNVPGYGRYEMAPHVRQAWGWNAIQGAYPGGQEAVRSGRKSLIQQDVDIDMGKALNPQKSAPIFRL